MKVQFKSRKLKSSIIKVTEKVKNNYSLYKDFIVYGVTKEDGITITGNLTSEDLSEYLVVGENTFAFNPYRVNIGSIGLSGKNFEGLVSPAYVVFKTKNDLIPEFLFQYLKSDIGIKLINWYGNRGGVRNALRFDDLGEIDIPDLTVDEQREALIKLNIAQTKLNDIFNTISKQRNYLQQLRQSILQDAVQGKLSEQNPSHEDAATLLKHIKAEKQKLIKEGKVKKEKELPPITEDEIPFEIPKGWVWCRWRDLLAFGQYSMKRGPFGSSLKKEMFVEKGIRVFEQYNPINDDPYWARYYITEKKYEELKAFKTIAGDLLISCSGATLGRITELPKNVEFGIINQALLKVTLNKDIMSNSYFIHLFRSLYFQAKIFEEAGGSAIPNMVGVNVLKQILIPLPPLHEQQRIVAKVQQLQKQLNQLESQVQQSREYAEQLLQAVLKEAFEEKGTVYEENEIVTMAAEE